MTDAEELDVVEDMVVKGEVVARDDVYTSILLKLPVGKSETLSLCKQIALGQLVTPVSLVCFFQVSQDSHTRETQDG